MLCVTCLWMRRKSLYKIYHVTVSGQKLLEDDSTENVLYVCKYIEMTKFYFYILFLLSVLPDSRKKTLSPETELNDFVRCSALCREQLCESLVPLQM